MVSNYTLIKNWRRFIFTPFYLWKPHFIVYIQSYTNKSICTAFKKKKHCRFDVVIEVQNLMDRQHLYNTRTKPLENNGSSISEAGLESFYWVMGALLRGLCFWVKCNSKGKGHIDIVSQNGGISIKHGWAIALGNAQCSHSPGAG